MDLVHGIIWKIQHLLPVLSLQLTDVLCTAIMGSMCALSIKLVPGNQVTCSMLLVSEVLGGGGYLSAIDSLSGPLLNFLLSTSLHIHSLLFHRKQNVVEVTVSPFRISTIPELGSAKGFQEITCSLIYASPFSYRALICLYHLIAAKHLFF